jgi:hypothetical protein
VRGSDDSMKELEVDNLFQKYKYSSEIIYILQLHVISPYTWIGTGVVRNKWVWLDGSGSLETLFEGIC